MNKVERLQRHFQTQNGNMGLLRCWFQTFDITSLRHSVANTATYTFHYSVSILESSITVINTHQKYDYFSNFRRLNAQNHSSSKNYTLARLSEKLPRNFFPYKSVIPGWTNLIRLRDVRLKSTGQIKASDADKTTRSTQKKKIQIYLQSNQARCTSEQALR